jgi:DNA-binding winged helix-turn-helix (wHTH) protein/tetratricopeptide (TPR) repeat protein
MSREAKPSTPTTQCSSSDVSADQADALDTPRLASAFQLGELLLDRERFELRRGRERIPVQPKVLQLLFHLVDQRQRMVPNAELLRVLWPDECVTNASIKRAIRGARKALGDDGDSQSSIRTMRGRGYQLVMPVSAYDPPRANVLSTPQPSAASASTGPSVSTVDTFVGRRGALGLLDANMRGAFSGHGRTLLLIGEPGIGKTRLLLELARRAKAAGADTWFGRCIEDEGAPAFWPWTQALRDGERDRGGQQLFELMGNSAADIVEGIPELRPSLPELPLAPSIGEHSARFRFFDGIVALLKRACAARPIALLFDDLQYADQPTLRLLSFVARQVDTSHLLIACTLRPIASQLPAVRETLANLVDGIPASCIELEGLDPSDVGRYLELQLGQRGPAAVVAQLHRLTGGNPLFLQQIAHGWHSSGRLDGAIDWAELMASTRAQGLTGAIVQRLAQLAPATRELLRIATVLGTEFSVARLSRLSDRDAGSVLSLLSAAQASGLVRELAIGVLRFTHILVRNALYDQLDVGTRALIHAKAGALLEAEGPSTDASLPELAHHFAHAWPAHDAGRALHYTLRAAEAAKARLAYEEAADHFERALHMLAQGAADPQRRLQLLVSQGEALSHAAEVSRARAVLFDAVALARELGDSDVIARAATLIAALPESGNVDWQLIGLLREALASVADHDPQYPYLLALLAKCTTYSPDCAAREALALSAIDRATQITDPRLRAETLHQCHRALAEPKHLERREQIGEELARLGHRHGDHLMLWQATTAEIQNCLERGDFAGVDRASSLIEALAAQLREPNFRWYIATFRAMRLYVAGDLAGAEQTANEALNLGACVGDATARHAYCLQVTGWQRVLGRTSECEVLAREMMLRHPGLPGWRLLLAGLEADRGHNESARKFLAEVHADPSLLHEPFTMSLLCFLAELCSFFGTVEMARWLYQRMIPYGELWGNVGLGLNTYGPVGRQLGMLAIRIGDLDAAESHLDAALDSCAAADSPTFTSLTCIVYARALLKRETASARRRAQDMLVRSEELNRPRGWHGNSALVHYMTTRAGLLLPDPSQVVPSRDSSGLTSAE